ncbi:Allatostatin-A receptor [Orchesella cincta]|uniref:Allatostatin-A receptor n=1 Tax=Orchesella cincta TaxID=48709 RepID=A0A1D2N366_ORCCI|nr:Allatostatin-A receptor [Orchesella cincta]
MMYAYEEQAACTFNQDYNHAAFQISFMLTSYAIPLTIICLLYFGMLFRLWKSVSSAGASRQSLRGKKRVTRMVVVVVGVFAVCWLPIQTVLLLKSLNLYQITDLTVAIQITAHVLGYMNSCVNPILYAFLSDNFRKAFRKVIQCKALLLPNHPPPNGSQIIKHRQSNAHSHGPPLLHNEVTKETALLALHCENGGTRGATNHVITFKNGSNPLENQDIV